MNSTKEIIKELKEHLVNNFGNEVKDVILFGSQNSGSVLATSDYDVLIIIDKKDYTSADKSKILDLSYDLNLKYNILLDIHILSTQEKYSRRGNQPIFTDALETGLYA